MATKEIMTPGSVGAAEDGLIPGRHSGRRAIEEALRRRAMPSTCGDWLKEEGLEREARREEESICG